MNGLLFDIVGRMVTDLMEVLEDIDKQLTRIADALERDNVSDTAE